MVHDNTGVLTRYSMLSRLLPIIPGGGVDGRLYEAEDYIALEGQIIQVELSTISMIYFFHVFYGIYFSACIP